MVEYHCRHSPHEQQLEFISLEKPFEEQKAFQAPPFPQ